MAEIRVALIERGIQSGSLTTIWWTLRRLGLTHKKVLRAAEQERRRMVEQLRRPVGPSRYEGRGRERAQRHEAGARRPGGGRVAELRPDKRGAAKKARPVDDLLLVPDVKEIMPRIKSEVLAGVVVCFTGVIPQNIDPQL